MIYPISISTITIGNINFSLYGSLLGLGFAIVILAIEKWKPNHFSIWDYFFIALSSVIFGRLAYLISSGNWDVFISLNTGGLRIYGAVIGAIIPLYFITKTKKTSLLQLLDNISIVLPFAQILGRIGNYLNQELYGKPCNHNFCLYVDPQHRPSEFADINYYHPVFLYEIVLNAINFLVLYVLSRKFTLQKGWIFGIWLFNYAVIRLITNRFRIDQMAIIGSFDISDLVSILIIVVILFLFLTNRLQRKTSN